MAKKGLILLLLFLPLWVWGQIISVGDGNVKHQGLPIEPAARFSYSQQLYYGSEIDCSGSITHIGFQYDVGSAVFYSGNKELKIWLGHSALSTLEEWVDPSTLSLVYDGILSLDYFDATLPGTGWLMIPLQYPFTYDEASNLIVAVDENTDAIGNTADDFLCWETVGFRALQCMSMQDNPDPQALPAPTVKNHLSNLRLDFSSAPDAPQNLYGYHEEGVNYLFWDAPEGGGVEAYRISRNGSFLCECSSCFYNDAAISAGTSYSYYVQARYPDGSISGHSNAIQIVVPEEGVLQLINESFEACEAFSQLIPGYQNLDLDNAANWGWTNVDYPTEGQAAGWIVFDPQLCNPAISDISAFSGDQMLMSAACVSPPNNDWLISPYLNLGDNATLSLKARSYTSLYGMERMRVLISNTDTSPESFKALHPAEYLEVPASWQEYSFELSAYAGENVYFAIVCVSLDAMALFIDDISLISEGGHLDNDDPQYSVAGVRNYPNPSRSSFKLSSEGSFEASIYNIRGQLLHRINADKNFDSASLKLASGLYLIRIKDASRQYTLKQVLLP